MMSKLSKIFNRHPFPIVSLIVWIMLVGIITAGSLYGNKGDSSAVSVNPNLQPTSALLARLSQAEAPEPTAPSDATAIQVQPVTPVSAPAWQAQEPYIGIWISQEELARLPVSGSAWDNLKAAADQELDDPDLSDLNDSTDVYVLAKALVYGRTGELQYRQEAIETIEAAMGTEEGSETLALGRNLVSYVIAADLVNLPETAPTLDETFRGWLRQLLTEKMDDDRSLQETHETRPNNWGTHAGASRAAVAIYLGDSAELEQTALVFKGWLGDQSAYTGFEYGRLDWQADPENPVGINPPGAVIDGHDVGGALPEEMRRGGRFRWPPQRTGYAWEGLQGAVVLAEILSRSGYLAWEWEEQALLRAVQFLYDLNWPAEGDDIWQVWLINQAYDTDVPASTPERPGKNMGWTDWTFR
jgi:hypothetical protein